MRDLAALVERVRALADEQRAGSRRRLAEIDETLTDGYAYALALEGEALRMERRLANIAETSESANPREIPALTARLGAVRKDLATLRAPLRRLRERADVLRASIR